MPTTDITTTYIARALVLDSDARIDGVTGQEDDYGVVTLVRRTITERKADGHVGRTLSRSGVDEPLIERMTADEALALAARLTRAAAASLRVEPPLRATMSAALRDER